MKIYIVGVSGSGVSTLGKALSEQLKIPFWDMDDYYWENSYPPFKNKTDNEFRNRFVHSSLNQTESWILGGTSDSWTSDIQPDFDRVIFLWIPVMLREKRLRKREQKRYGEPLPIWSINFIRIALEYDNIDLPCSLRNRLENWLSKLNCPVLRLEGDLEMDHKLPIALEFIVSGEITSNYKDQISQKVKHQIYIAESL